MKKIIIYAYTKFNLGDDLFIKVLCERYPKTKFIIYAPKDYKKCFKDIKNIKCYSSQSILNRAINYIFRKINKNNFVESYLAKKCDAGVYIGGSLFIQGDGWKENFEQYTKTKKIDNKPFYLLGVNFGPYNDKEFYIEHKQEFKKYTDICFREKYSYELFKDLPNVRIADDIIFQYKKPNVKEDNSVSISVIKPSYRKHLKMYDEIYYKAIKDMAIKFIKEGMKVNLVSFCEYEGDVEAIEKIVSLIPNQYLDKINKHYYKINIDETINLLAKSKFIIASRFHAMILGWVFNKPVLPIVYSSKMTNVINDIEFNGLYIDFENLESIDTEEVLKSIYNNKVNVSKQVENAKNHFKNLDEFLKC